MEETTARHMAPRIVSGLAILGVAAVAGLISYQHIEDLSLALHQTPLVARLMPFAVDGLITVGSVVLLQGGKLGWLGIGPGVATSLYANFESGIEYGWRAAIWACIPAVSFAVASFILERWIKAQASASKTAADTAQDAPESETVADAPEVPDAPESEESQDAPKTETVTPPARPKRRRGMTPEQLEEAACKFAAEIAAGECPSQRQIQTRVHVGRPRAKQIEAHLSALIDARTVATVNALTDAQVRVHEPVSV
jgi:hypothetical protein